jgi:hypothetical protein
VRQKWRPLSGELPWACGAGYQGPTGKRGVNTSKCLSVVLLSSFLAALSFFPFFTGFAFFAMFLLHSTRNLGF